MSVSYSRDGDIAFVELQNSPVNAMGLSVRQGLMKAAEWAENQDGLLKVIVSGQGKLFAAGGDISEFNSPPVAPHLPDVLAKIENSAVPWVAAINGAALGGGLELALACRYRILKNGAVVGLPETSLGIVPGAGGTQRLSRLVGFTNALELMVFGKPIQSSKALKLSLVDELADDPVATASLVDVAMLQSVVSVSQLPAPILIEKDLEAIRTKAARRMKNQIAPQKAIELGCMSTDRSFEDAMKAEREVFLALRGSKQAKALLHIFLAERRAQQFKSSSMGSDQALDAVAVVGGGRMGAAIAYAMLSKKINVVLIETDVEGVARAKVNVDEIVNASRKRNLISSQQADEIIGRLLISDSLDNAVNVGLVIEAAFESMDVKKVIFANLEKALPAHVVLATNTSYLDINEIAQCLENPSRLVGLHFFAPAHIMKLLEIVKGAETSKSALELGYNLASRLKKIPVQAGVCDGFIGNRILARYREAADTLLIDGTDPWTVDEAMEEFGYAMGPYEAQDMSGLEIAYANRKRQKEHRDPKRRYIPISDRMVSEGRLGRKSGVGWYRYPGGAGKVIDPLLEDLIREEAHFEKVTRTEYSNDEIRHRLLLAMINEAAEILNEGIAQCSSDIDIVTVSGYGFPRWRGGLMYYADYLGPRRVLEGLQELCKDDPVVWQPSSAIVRCVEKGESFSSYFS